MTLVELLVAMTITSLVLLGISGALVVGYRAANLWSQKITEAQTANQLAGWLDQDLHRYVPCSPPGATELDFCLPHPATARDFMVTYTPSPASGSCPCAVFRTDTHTHVQSVATRDLVARPTFFPSCDPNPSGDQSGYLRIVGLQYEPSGQAPAPAVTPAPMLLYFRAPQGGCP
jgi:hypothetical protein